MVLGWTLPLASHSTKPSLKSSSNLSGSSIGGRITYIEGILLRLEEGTLEGRCIQSKNFSLKSVTHQPEELTSCISPVYLTHVAEKDCEVSGNGCELRNWKFLVLFFFSFFSFS